MRIVLAIGVAFFATESWAQGEGEPDTAFSDYESHTKGAFVGGAVGLLDYEGLFGASDTAFSPRVFGGFRFGNKWTVEGSFFSTGTLSDTVDIDARVTADYQIFSVRGLYQGGPFVFGIGYWYGDEFSTGFGASNSRSDSGILGSVGLEWNQGKLVYRVEYELFDSDKNPDVDTSMLSFGARLRFR